MSMSPWSKLIWIFQNDSDAPASNDSDELDCQGLSAAPEISNSTVGNSDNWMALSISGDKPTPRFNVKSLLIFTPKVTSYDTWIWLMCAYGVAES